VRVCVCVCARAREREREREKETNQGIVAFVRKPCNIIEKALTLQFRDLLPVLQLVAQHGYFEFQLFLLFFPNPAA
jgi:hypothetical protein